MAHRRCAFELSDLGLALRIGKQRVERLGPGEHRHLVPGTVHRFRAVSDCLLFEVSTPELDDVVRIEVLDRDHRFLQGVLEDGDDPLWWLEGSSYPIRVLDPERVQVLITSNELEQKYGEAPVAVTFAHGEGEVLHMISHYYLQRAELLTLPLTLALAIVVFGGLLAAAVAGALVALDEGGYVTGTVRAVVKDGSPLAGAYVYAGEIDGGDGKGRRILQGDARRDNKIDRRTVRAGVFVRGTGG